MSLKPQNKETLILAMKRDLKDNVNSLLDNMSEIIKTAKSEDYGQSSKIVQNEEELFETQVRAANMLRAGQSLINLVKNIKELYILNDFRSINQSISSNITAFEDMKQNIEEKLGIIKEEMISNLYELEEEYYTNPYK